MASIAELRYTRKNSDIIYSKILSAVRVDEVLTEWFRVTVRVRQGCNLSPYLFNSTLEAMMIQH